MKSVITRFAVEEDAVTLAVTPYRAEVQGKYDPRLKVQRVQDLKNGGYYVLVQAPKGKLALSTMDALARRVDVTARVLSNLVGVDVHTRVYAVGK